MEKIDYGRMRDELSALTMRQLRAIAKSEGICLGYAGGRKASAVDEIVGQRRHRDRAEGGSDG